MTEKQAEAVEALERLGSVKAVARELDLTPKSVRDRLKGAGVQGEHQPRPVKSGGSSVKSLTDFRQTYDKDTIIPRKIEAGIAEIGTGWVYESEFVRIAGVTYSDLGMYREAYADHVVYIKRESKRAWAGTPELAQQMREML